MASTMELRIWSTDDEGYEVEDVRMVPARWIICDRCHGVGHHGNPAFDGMSVSTMQEEWDPEEIEDLFTGRYDVRCTECQGTGKVQEPADPTDRAAYRTQQAEQADGRRADWKTYCMESGLPPSEW